VFVQQPIPDFRFGELRIEDAIRTGNQLPKLLQRELRIENDVERGRELSHDWRVRRDASQLSIDLTPRLLGCSRFVGAASTGQLEPLSCAIRHWGKQRRSDLVDRCRAYLPNRRDQRRVLGLLAGGDLCWIGELVKLLAQGGKLGTRCIDKYNLRIRILANDTDA
jgi:hypothetical protein